MQQPLQTPAVWHAESVCLERDSIHMSSNGVLELETAVQNLMDRSLVWVEQEGYLAMARPLTKEDFALPTLQLLLLEVAQQVAVGKGWAVLRGLPVQRWSRVQNILTLHGIGLHLGHARQQNKKGHLIGHVKDTGIDSDQHDPTTRIYLTRVAQPWHCDSADVVGLMCLQPAEEGGMSSWSSSHAAYNELLHCRPDLAQVLAGPWFLDRKNEIPPGKLPYYCLPIVNHHQALELFLSILSSDKLRVDHWLEKGDLQILNNHCMAHTRTAFKDNQQDTEHKRHLLRLWVALPEGLACELAPAYTEVYGSTQIGDRGGILYQASQRDCIPLEAE